MHHDRYCSACDWFFRHRHDMRHTYEAPGCDLARDDIGPRPYTKRERECEDYVRRVIALLDQGL